MNGFWGSCCSDRSTALRGEGGGRERGHYYLICQQRKSRKVTNLAVSRKANGWLCHASYFFVKGLNPGVISLKSRLSLIVNPELNRTFVVDSD